MIKLNNLLPVALLSFVLQSCSAEPNVRNSSQPTEPMPSQPIPPTSSSSKMKLSIGSTILFLTLEDNDAARALAARLPFTASMGDLHANEKYYYLPFDLPTQPIAPQTIRAGDLMLFGSNCLVLFYQSFATSYRYTRLGRLDRPELLASVLGSGTVSVAFYLD